MRFSWLLRACFRSEPELHGTGPPSCDCNKWQNVIETRANAGPVQPASCEEDIDQEGFKTKGCVPSTGTKSNGCNSSETDNADAARSGESVVKSSAARTLEPRRDLASTDSPINTTITRSFTAPGIEAIDSQRYDTGSVQYSLEDAEDGLTPYARPQTGEQQQQPQHQCSTHPFTPEYKHRIQQQELSPQIFVTNLGAVATNVVVMTASDDGSAAGATTITPITTAPLPSPTSPLAIAGEAVLMPNRSLDAAPSAPLPPRTLQQPLPSMRQARIILGSVPLTRPITAPVRRFCNGDFFHLLSPLRSGNSGPPAAPATVVAFPRALQVDATLPTGVFSAGRRSDGTSDLQTASGQEAGSFSSTGGDGGGGRIVMAPWTGPGLSSRTLSDMPGLDLRNSMQLMALCDFETAALNTSQNLEKNSPVPRGSSSERAALFGSGGGGGAGCSTSGKTAVLAATAAAAECELGLIHLSSLSELAGQLEGLKWLASGSSGRVFTGCWKGSPVAVKVLISATPDQLRDSSREALLSRVVSHPAICQCYTVCSECITAEHLQLTRQRAQPAATGSRYGFSLASAVDTLVGMLPVLPQVQLDTSVPSPTTVIPVAGSNGCPGPGGNPAPHVLSTEQMAGAFSGASDNTGRRSHRVLYERQSFSSAARATAAGEELAAVQAAPSPSQSTAPSQREDIAASWQGTSPSEPLRSDITAYGSGDGESLIDGAGSSWPRPSIPATSISVQDMDDGHAARRATGAHNLARIRVQQHLAQLQCKSTSTSSDHLLLPAQAEESGGERFERRSDGSTAAAVSSVKSSMVAAAAAPIAVAGGGAGGGGGGGGLTPSGSANNSSRGGLVSSLVGWGCGTASQVSGSSLLPATSHGSTTPVGREGRRCLALGGAAQAVTDLNTTLSLSELLRSYTPADEDNNSRMQSLPAVLLSMGAVPGSFCTIVVLEWCNQGNLLQAIRSRPFNPERSPDNHAGLLMLLRTALEIAQGLRYLHSLDIVHGDLKPSNVLLQSHGPTTVGSTVCAPDMRGYVAKVADFGLSMLANQNSVGGVLGGGPGMLGGGGGEGHWGALAYMAPEVPESGPSKKSDVYSFGCVLYHMCTSKQPFQGIRQGRLLVGLATGSIVLQWPENVYKVLRRLGEACCAPNPRDRPSFDKVVDALQRTISYVARSPAPSACSHTGHETLGSSTNSTDAEAAAAAVEAAAAAAAAWRSAVTGFTHVGSLPRSCAPPPAQEHPT